MSHKGFQKSVQPFSGPEPRTNKNPEHFPINEAGKYLKPGHQRAARRPDILDNVSFAAGAGEFIAVIAQWRRPIHFVVRRRRD